MLLNKLPKTTARKQKRVGRGIGSGKGGHTSGRGAKGDKARGNTGLTFSGTKIKKGWLKRLPLARGKGKFKSLHQKPLIVDIKYLNLLPAGTLVNRETLISHKIISTKIPPKTLVKILGNASLNVSLKVALPCSKAARKEVEKAGGEIIK